MSLASKVTLTASLVGSTAIIYYVHHKQQSDRENLRRGVIRDLEQQQMKRTQNLYLLEQQSALTNRYREVEKRRHAS